MKPLYRITQNPPRLPPVPMPPRSYANAPPTPRLEQMIEPRDRPLYSHMQPWQNEVTEDEEEGCSDCLDETVRYQVIIETRDPQTGTVRERNFDYKKYLEKRNVDKLGAEMTPKSFILRKFLQDNSLEIYPPKIIYSSELTIMNPELGSLLQTVIKSYTLHPLSQGMLKLISPFYQIIQHWDALESETQKEGGTKEDQAARSDLQDLLSQLSEWSGDPGLDRYMQARKDLVFADSITFEAMWTIFPPGTLVYSKTILEQDQVLLVLDSRPPSLGAPGSNHWLLRCLTYDWNGACFDRYLITFSIDRFDETKPISALPIYPWKYVPNKEEMKEKLIARGKKFRRICVASSGSGMFRYQGQAMIDRKGFGFVTERDGDGGTAYPGSTFPTMQPQLRGSLSRDIGYHGSIELVMVDFASHYKYAQVGQCVGEAALNIDKSECRCKICLRNDDLQKALRTRYDAATGAPEENWEEEQFMLCSARVMGYILQEKMWAQFLVNGIEDIDVDGSHTAFNDRLVLPEDPVLDRKAILMGLVKSHYAVDSDNLYQLEDIVPGKGKGLIILLYGPPGVGKTSTAETIAIATRKPLFSIGVADVGTSARYVEPNLESIFDLAQTWKAILLIDEADVFLQSRGSGQVGATTERNALVSVFLRVLEYYRGIMILTTNQIAQFDVAVQSRINIAFKYDSLTAKQTADIFKMFLKQYKKNDMVNMEEWNDINNWCEKKLPKKGFDGRQIRSVITSAVGLAASKDDKLGVAYLEDVVEIVSDFKNELSKQMDRYTQAQAFIEQRQ